MSNVDWSLSAESNASDGLHIAAVEGGFAVSKQAPPQVATSDFRLFGYFKSVVDLDAQIPYGGFQL